VAGQILVVHVKKLVVGGGRMIYCGRQMPGLPGSVFGNPFRMESEKDRAAVIEKYRVWLWKKLKEEGGVWESFEELAEDVFDGYSIQLACWCAPSACHCDVLRKALLWRVGQLEKEQVG
jgi:hypothetical protein